MKITDEMAQDARIAFFNRPDLPADKRWRAALESALSAAPPSDDYRRGLEDAARCLLIDCHDDMTRDEEADAIRALGEKGER